MQKTDTEKTNLHPRNQHKLRYDLDILVQTEPKLSNFVFTNEYANKTIDFSNPEAVKLLNKALLLTYYHITSWDIPKNYLCPPIPGRADYIHYLADLLASSNHANIPKGDQVLILDIGVGANCIYPIIGAAEYGWHFVGSDIDDVALQNCKKIIAENSKLIEAISLQQQTEPRYIFKNIMLPEDKFAATICNPPFHNSKSDAEKEAFRKVYNLTGQKEAKISPNFGGQNTELWCDGGELGFITQMIYESAKYPMQCLWYTCLVSKKSNLKSLYKILNKVNIAETKTIEMAQGQKQSRILAWSFLSKEQQQNWKFE